MITPLAGVGARNDMQFLNNSEPDRDVRRQRTTLEAAMEGARWQGEVVQISHGEGEDRIDIVTSDNCSFAHVRFPHEATVNAAQPKGFVTFTMPVADEHRLRVNGVTAPSQALFMNFGCDETHSYGLGRNLVAGRIRTEAFLAALGRITSSTPCEDAVPRGLVILEPAVRQELLRRLLAFIHDKSDLTETTIRHETAVIVAMAQAVISSRHAVVVSSTASKVFKRACRLIERSTGTRPALSDMCGVAGYSTPVVTASFRDIAGTSPARYARHRSLARAHRALREGGPAVASVKAIALENGFSELGRFSGLYKRVYGQLPSETLRMTR